MKLTVPERFAISALLPTQGNYSRMRRVGELREALTEFTDDEKQKLGVKDVLDDDGEATGHVQWPVKNAKIECEVLISESMTVVIVDTLKKLDDKNEIKGPHVSLFKKFVELPAEEARAAAKEAEPKPT